MAAGVAAEGRRVTGASDSELLAATRAGSDEAFLVLYDRYRDLAWRVARSVTSNDLDAEDAVAEAFARVYVAASGREIESFRAYLAAAVRNCATDSLRRRERPADAIHIEETAPAVDERVLDLTDQDLVARAFSTLPERYRSALWMSEVEAFSAREVGHALGTSANAAAALAMRARERLRQAFLVEHLASPLEPDCASTTRQLAALVRGAASKRVTVKVEAHVAHCRGCTARLREVRGVNTSLAAAIPLAPATLLTGDGLLARVRGMADGPLPQVTLQGWAELAVPYASGAQALAERVFQPVAAAVAGLLVAGAVAVGPSAPAGGRGDDPVAPETSTEALASDLGAGGTELAGWSARADEPGSPGADGLVSTAGPGGARSSGTGADTGSDTPGGSQPPATPDAPDAPDAPSVEDPAGDVGLIAPTAPSPQPLPGAEPQPTGLGTDDADEVRKAAEGLEDEADEATDDVEPHLRVGGPNTSGLSPLVPSVTGG